MSDITTGYFSNHKLNVNDLNSLQNSPELFKPQLTVKEAIIDFLRKLLFLDTRSNALSELNNYMYENHFVHSPIEILTIFERLLPEDLKDNITFSFHSVNDKNRLNSIEIQYHDKVLTLEYDNYWLTKYDEKIINESEFNIIMFSNENNINYCGNSTNQPKPSGEVMGYYDDVNKNIREDFFHVQIANRVSEKLNLTGAITGKLHAEIIYDNKDEIIKLDRFVLTDGENLCLEIPLRAGDDVIIKKILKGSVLVESSYTCCPYKSMLDQLKNIDESLIRLTDKKQDKFSEEKIKHINIIIESLKNLKLSIEINNIVRNIDTNVTIKAHSIEHCIIMTLASAMDIESGNLSALEESDKIEEIKKKIELIKWSIINKNTNHPERENEHITYANLFIERLHKKMNTLSDVQREKNNNVMINVESLLAYLTRSQDNVSDAKIHLEKTTENENENKNDIVDIPELLIQEDKAKISHGLYNLRNYLDEEHEITRGSEVDLLSEIEAILFSCQSYTAINIKGYETSKAADKLYSLEAERLIPSDNLYDYREANKCLYTEIIASLNLSHDNSDVFINKTVIFLDKIYKMKTDFFREYVNIFWAEKMIKHEDTLIEFRLFLSKVEMDENLNLTDAERIEWAIKANQRLLSEVDNVYRIYN